MFFFEMYLYSSHPGAAFVKAGFLLVFFLLGGCKLRFPKSRKAAKTQASLVVFNGFDGGLSKAFSKF